MARLCAVPSPSLFCIFYGTVVPVTFSGKALARFGSA